MSEKVVDLRAKEQEQSDYLSLTELLDAQDIEYADVIVPKIGKNGADGKLRIGSLTADDMMEWLEANEGPAKKTAALRLIMKSLVDKDGNRIGTDSGLVNLAKRNTKTINLILNEILKLNDLGKFAQEQAKNDSSEAPAGTSPTS